MKYLIDWGFKLVITIVLWTIAGWCLCIMALMLWDGKFIDIGEQALDRVWRIKK